MNLKYYKKYKVIWKDHCSRTKNRWYSIEDADADLVVCTTIGHLIFENEEAITLAHTLNYGTKGGSFPTHYCGDQTIGKVMIVSIEEEKDD